MLRARLCHGICAWNGSGCRVGNRLVRSGYNPPWQSRGIGRNAFNDDSVFRSQTPSMVRLCPCGAPAYASYTAVGGPIKDIVNADLCYSHYQHLDAQIRPTGSYLKASHYYRYDQRANFTDEHGNLRAVQPAPEPGSHGYESIQAWHENHHRPDLRNVAPTAATSDNKPRRRRLPRAASGTRAIQPPGVTADRKAASKTRARDGGVTAGRSPGDGSAPARSVREETGRSLAGNRQAAGNSGAVMVSPGVTHGAAYPPAGVPSRFGQRMEEIEYRRDHPVIVCEGCGKPIDDPIRPGVQKYHDHACQQRAYRERQKTKAKEKRDNTFKAEQRKSSTRRTQSGIAKKYFS